MPPLEDNLNRKQHMQPKYELQQYPPPMNSIGTCWTSVKYIDESLASPFPSSVQGWLLCVYQTNTKSLIFIDTDHTTEVHQ